MPAKTKCLPQDGQVGLAISRINHEVKDGPVVPEVEPAPEVVLTYVGVDPGDLVGALGQIGLGLLQRGDGEIGDGDVAVAGLQKLTGQARRAAPSVEDLASRPRSVASMRARDRSGIASNQLS